MAKATLAKGEIIDALVYRSGAKGAEVDKVPVTLWVAHLPCPIKGCREIASVWACTSERLQTKSSGYKLNDRRCVVCCPVNVIALGMRRDNDCWDARARPPPISPTVTGRWRNVVPEAAILVIGHDHGHFIPLRTLP